MRLLRNSILSLLVIGFTEIVISIWFSDTLLPILESIGLNEDLISKIFVTEIITGFCLFVAYVVLSLQKSK